jgi:hypothetical protein
MSPASDLDESTEPLHSAATAAFPSAATRRT